MAQQGSCRPTVPPIPQSDDRSSCSEKPSTPKKGSINQDHPIAGVSTPVKSAVDSTTVYANSSTPKKCPPNQNHLKVSTPNKSTTEQGISPTTPIKATVPRTTLKNSKNEKCDKKILTSTCGARKSHHDYWSPCE